MGYPVKQSQTAQPLVFLMIDSNDHLSGKAGLTPTVTLSKNGAAFAAPAGAIAEIANGWYKVAGNATDTGTLGPLLLHATSAGADPTDDRFDVVAYDPQSATNLGLSSIGADTAGTTTLLARLTSGRAANLDLIDAAVSSRSTFDPSQTIGVQRNQDAVTNPTYYDAFLGAWSSVYAKQKEVPGSSPPTYAVMLPNGTDPARTFVLTTDAVGNPLTRS
jgi:hypothetical protein